MAVYVALDFETAGYYAGCACAVGMAKIMNDEIGDTYYSLIRPPSSRIHFTDIHGLAWKDLKNAPTFSEIWPKMLVFMAGADFLMAHNARFDRNVLDGCCQRFGQGAPDHAFLCTLKGSRKAIRLKSHSLNNMCSYFGIPLNHHHAASDAFACAEIFIRLKKMGLNDLEMKL